MKLTSNTMQKIYIGHKNYFIQFGEHLNLVTNGNGDMFSEISQTLVYVEVKMMCVILFI